MSRETLDGDAAAVTHPAPGTHPAPVLLALDPQTDPAGPPEPPGRTAPSSTRPTLRVVQATVAVLLVAVLAGSLGVLVEQRRAQEAAADGVRLVGVFLHDGSSRGQGASGDGTVVVTGNLELVNGGPDPVEVVGAEVAGIAVRLLNPKRTVEPGETGRVRAELEVPCGGVPRERVFADVKVLPPGGSGRVERIEVVPMRLPFYYGLADYLPVACSEDLLVRVTRMEMDDAGAVRLELRSESPRATEVRVRLSPLTGGQVNGSSSITTVVPAGGIGRLLLTVGIDDCVRARRVLGSSYELLTVEADISGGTSLAYLEGWRSTVGTAAFGFALARQCR